MSEECDTSTENGHNFCMIPYTGSYNLNDFIKIPKGISGCSGTLNSTSGNDDPRCYNLKNDPYGKITKIRGENEYLIPGKNMANLTINYGPKLPVVGYFKTESQDMEIKNKSINLPMDEDCINPDDGSLMRNLIMGIEIVPNQNYVVRLSGLYYADVTKISKVSGWKGYNEGTGKIDLFESNRKDIEGIGWSEIQSKKILLNGSFQDSALCGIWYKYSPARDYPNQSFPIIGLCAAYRRFFDNTINTEYVFFEGGSITVKSFPPNTSWFGGECIRGEFISQLTFYYNDFDTKQLEQKPEFFGISLSVGGMGINIESYHDGGFGLKGIGKYRSLNYNVKDGLYKWIGDVDKLTCCQLLSDKQYNDDTVEKHVCRENLNLKVNNNFPNAFPNDQCKILLGNWCATSYIDEYKEEIYNIEDDLCKKACNISDVDCDRGIKNYCLRPEMLAGGTGTGLVSDITSEFGKTYIVITDLTMGYLSFKVNIDNTEQFREDYTSNPLRKGDYLEFELKPSDLTYPYNIIRLDNTKVDTRKLKNGTNYDLGKFTKGEICGCLTFQNYDDIDPLSSVPLSFKNLLNQKLLNKAGINLDKQECILPQCSQSPYKLLSMKKNLEKEPCNKKELCFGNGYAIPDYKDKNTKVGCISYQNAEDECIDPLTPKITVIPDPFTDGCKNLITNELVMPKYKPAECVYGDKWYPEDPWNAKCEMHVDPEDGVEKLMLRSYRQLEKPSIPDVPEGEPNPQCPPKCGEGNYRCDYPLKTPDEREPVEKWEPCYNDGIYIEDDTPPSSGITKIGTTILIFAIIIGLIFAIFIKIIKK